jgi:hypothetical protein
MKKTVDQILRKNGKAYVEGMAVHKPKPKTQKGITDKLLMAANHKGSQLVMRRKNVKSDK